jgi:hypothetical protein
MQDSDRMDVYMVCGDKDIRLLRHFLTSYNLFFKSPGKIYLWAWKKHEYLLREISLPKNLILLFKDDVPELTEDDFKNQMYLKLIAHRYVETDWFWVADTDYVIVSPLWKSDFFHEGKPYWFYCGWDEIPKRTWRSGSEAFLGKAINMQYMDQQQYVHGKNISYDFALNYNPEKILTEQYLAAEQVVYGAYAFENYHDSYEWVDYATYDGQIVSYKVNQRPPTYCELDDKVRLADLPAAKYHVLWSHWEKAEEKMVEFLLDAQMSVFGKIVKEPEKTKLFRYLHVLEVDCGYMNGLDGIYSDGWLMRDIWFCIATDHRSNLVMEFNVPGVPSCAELPLSLLIDIDGQKHIEDLRPGSQKVLIRLEQNKENRVSLRFEGGFPEPNGSRTLYALLTKCSLNAITHSDEVV